MLWSSSVPSSSGEASKESQHHEDQNHDSPPVSPFPGLLGGIADENESELTACQKECRTEQRALVSCVDSIRSTRLAASSDNSDHDVGHIKVSERGSSSATPECLPLAVAAWTRCCEEANSREQQEKENQNYST